jgi:serine/threonine protein phosphatase PrpC
MLLVKDEFPAAFSEALVKQGDCEVQELLELAWETTCQTYQTSCISGDECVADYDPREGLLMANTGSLNAIAGTTTTIFCLDKRTSQSAMLHCGDSRGLIIRPDGSLAFETTDHTPESDYDRLVEGKAQGYSAPECKFSKWSIPVGDYEYGVARSLEGPFATSRGIVSTPTVSQFPAPAFAEDCITVVLATDGLWEVLGSEQVARTVTQLRQQRSMGASDVARTLCSLALEKGSSDNVSVVVVCLE